MYGCWHSGWRSLQHLPLQHRHYFIAGGSIGALSPPLPPPSLPPPPSRLRGFLLLHRCWWGNRELWPEALIITMTGLDSSVQYARRRRDCCLLLRLIESTVVWILEKKLQAVDLSFTAQVTFLRVVDFPWRGPDASHGGASCAVAHQRLGSTGVEILFVFLCIRVLLLV